MDDIYTDDEIPWSADSQLRLSADGMRALRKATGRTMTDLMQDDDDDALRFQVIAFAELYRTLARQGHLPDAGELWERAGRAYVVMEPPAVVDPTDGVSYSTSPHSAGTGE